MELSAHILALASLVFFAALCVRYFTHMFQLNSYTASVQFRWMRENRLRLVPCAILLAASLACAFVKRPVYGYLFFAAAALLTALFYLPKKAKKPLVYTARVKRLLVTCGLFTLLFAAIGVLLGGSGEFLLLGIVFAALPFILILANRVNAPMEKAIRDHYIRDAKKCLPRTTVCASSA